MGEILYYTSVKGTFHFVLGRAETPLVNRERRSTRNWGVETGRHLLRGTGIRGSGPVVACPVSLDVRTLGETGVSRYGRVPFRSTSQPNGRQKRLSKTSVSSLPTTGGLRPLWPRTRVKPTFVRVPGQESETEE